MMKHWLSGSFFAGLMAGLVIGCAVVTGVMLFVLNDQQTSGAASRDGATTDYGRIHNEPSGSAEIDSNFKIGSLDDLEQFESPIARTRAVHNLLFKLDTKTLKDLVRQSESVEIRALRTDVQTLIVQRIASHDPLGALSEISMYPDVQRRALIGTVFLEWAASELDKAVDHAQNLDLLDRREAIRGILKARDDFTDEERRSLARKLGDEQIAIDAIARRQTIDFISNPEESWRDVVAQMESVNGDSSSAIRDLALHVARAWIEQRGTDVLYGINESVVNQTNRQFIIGRLLEELSEGDDSHGFELAIDIVPDDPSIVYDAIRRWAKSDPKAALAAASSVQSQELRLGSQRVAMITWADASPTDLLKSLNSLDQTSEDLKALGRERALVALAETSTSAAIGYLDEVHNSRSKRNVARAIVENWITVDRNAALDWIRSEPQLEDMRRNLYEVAVRQLARKSPQQALELALGHSESGLEAEVIDEVSRTDVEEAISMLSSIRDEDTLKASYKSLGTRLLTQGKPDRVLELIGQQPESFQTQVLNGLAYTWAFNEPANLFKRLDALPNDEVRRTAATALRAANSLSKALSSEQIATLEKLTPDIRVGESNEVPLEELLSD